MKAAVLEAGMGTRLRSLSRPAGKPTLPVGDRSLVEGVSDTAVKAESESGKEDEWGKEDGYERRPGAGSDRLSSRGGTHGTRGPTRDR